jgi:hypothetical protein
MSRIVDRASAVVIGLALGASVALVATSNGCDPSADGCRFEDDGVTWQTVGAVTWPVCQWEDSPGPCMWDARRDGNGTGRSFTVDRDRVTYLP